MFEKSKFKFMQSGYAQDASLWAKIGILERFKKENGRLPVEGEPSFEHLVTLKKKMNQKIRNYSDSLIPRFRELIDVRKQ